MPGYPPYWPGWREKTSRDAAITEIGWLRFLQCIQPGDGPEPAVFLIVEAFLFLTS